MDLEQCLPCYDNCHAQFWRCRDGTALDKFENIDNLIAAGIETCQNVRNFLEASHTMLNHEL